MKKIAKLIGLVIAFILALVLCIIRLQPGEYTDNELEKVTEKAELVSEDFSSIVSCEGIDSMELEYDPINGITTKSIKFRVNSRCVLDVRYDDDNNIISSEIINELSDEASLRIVGILIVILVFIILIVSTVIGLIEDHVNRKVDEDDEEDEEDENRIRTVYEKRKFLWF